MLPQLDTTHFFSQAFWLIICFSILYFFTKNIIVKQIQKILHERSCTINSQLNIREDNNIKIAKLLKDAKKIEENAKLEAKKIESKMLEEFMITQKDIEKKSNDKIESEYIKAKKELEDQFMQFKQKELTNIAQNVANIVSSRIDSSDITKIQ